MTADTRTYCGSAPTLAIDFRDREVVARIIACYRSSQSPGDQSRRWHLVPSTAPFPGTPIKPPLDDVARASELLIPFLGLVLGRKSLAGTSFLVPDLTTDFRDMKSLLGLC